MKLKLSVIIEAIPTDTEGGHDISVTVRRGSYQQELSDEFIFDSTEQFVEALRASEIIQSAVDGVLLETGI